MQEEFLHWGLMPFKKFTQFEGRSRRKELWMYWAIVVAASLVANILSNTLSMLIALATLIPTLAVGARRLHDTDRSGWWQLIGLIPFLGWFVLLFFFVMEGTPGPNRFGENPKAGETGAFTPR